PPPIPEQAIMHPYWQRRLTLRSKDDTTPRRPNRHRSRSRSPIQDPKSTIRTRSPPRGPSSKPPPSGPRKQSRKSASPPPTNVPPKGPKSKDALPKTNGTASTKPPNGDVAATPSSKMDIDEDSDPETAQMRRMMGFAGFRTTKNTKVPGNDIYAVRKEKKTEYRQYMNRKILSKPDTSPFTLVLDTVEQGAGALVRLVVGVGVASKTHVIHVSQSSIGVPSGIDTHIISRRKTAEVLKKEILAAVPKGQTGKTPLTLPETLLILHPLPHSLLQTPNLPTYLLSLLSPTTSLFLIHHLDIPVPTQQPYTPNPLLLLRYTATTILTLSSFPQTLAKHLARNLARPEPLFGLEEGKEGVIVGLGANSYAAKSVGREGGMVLEMEYRRKSGRVVEEVFFLPLSPSSLSSPPQPAIQALERIKAITLLDEHPAFAAPTVTDISNGEGIQGEDLGGTFKLGLTEKQRRDREGVVLPYYDAQRGFEEGARILYEMGEEDDFDEEEDEI
ncbi:MAG: hypothetical protein Q9204_002078, partial [Flavoplaca sp. TL-2023a]